MQQEVFSRGMRALGAAWPERELTEGLLAAYWIALSRELGDGDFGYAVEAALKRCVFFPKPAELLTLAGPRNPFTKPALGWDEMTPRERAMVEQRNGVHA